MEMHPDALMEEMFNDAEFMSTISNVTSASSFDDDYDLTDSLYDMIQGMKE